MSEANWYADVFKTWQSKALGPKPTNDQLAAIHGLGARPGKQALANAMALRDCGVTGSQIVLACEAPQLNKMRGFIADGLVTQVPMPKVNNHLVYKIALTPKGLKRIEAAAKRAAALLEAGKVVVEAAGKAKATAKTEMPVKRAGKAKGAVKRPKGTKVAPKAQNAPAATPDLPEGIAEVVVPNGLDGDQPANSTGM